MRLLPCLLILLVLVVSSTAEEMSTQAPGIAGPGLTGGARLLSVYDEILNARFTHARELLATSCPPAPREACLALEGVIVWWQVVLDPDDRSLDARLESSAGAAIAAADAWTAREPKRAEAWFYLAGSYAPLVQLRVLRGERLAAAREGNRIRASLERALALDSTLLDAKFGIGLYHYYADVISAPARVVRWLLWLPGGDRRQGMQEMLDARAHGQLLKSEADFQLHWLYLWYEQQPQRALELLVELDRRYPANPVFLQRIAEVRSEYLHDHPASAAAWQRLIERARLGQTSAATLAETRGQLGLATERDAMYETDRAIDPLRALVAARPAAPVGAVALAQVLLGEAFDRLGRRADARAAYLAALDITTASADVRARARSGVRRQPDTSATNAYRLSLEGLRQLENADATAAVASLERARALRPDDPVIRYRYAHALNALGRRTDAAAQLAAVLQAREPLPAIVEASACVEYGALIEQSGDRVGALALYKRAVGVVGGAIPARAEAEAAIKRLGS